jgi:hypothetical protein
MNNNFAPFLILAPYLVNIMFSLFVAIAWIVAFVRLKHAGPATLALASLCGALMNVVTAAVWYQVTQGQHQLTQYMGFLGIAHIVLVDSLMIVGAFLLAFHRPKSLV